YPLKFGSFMSQPIRSLFILRQVDYRRGKGIILLRFKRLSNQTYDWSEKHIFRTFTEGLKLKIREEVKARQSYTLKAAISFARHQEERLNYEAQRTRVTPGLVAPKLSPPLTINRSPQPTKLIREDFPDGSTKEPKLEDMILEPKEKDTL
ncbi:hypothetical protein BHE74_00049138, partial [Ensete ventricosum]